MFAKPIFKYIAKKGMTKGYTPKPKKVLDYYEYEGKKFSPKDLMRVQRRGEKGKLITGLIPRQVEEARIAGISIKPTKPTKPKPSDKKLEAIKKLDALSDDELRYLTEKQSRVMALASFTIDIQDIWNLEWPLVFLVVSQRKFRFHFFKF